MVKAEKFFWSALGAVLALTLGVFLVVALTLRPEEGTGFTRQVWWGTTSCGPGVPSAGTQIVSEPFVALGTYPQFCSRWTAFMAVAELRTEEFTLDSEGSAVMRVDGREVVADHEPHPRREGRGRVDLPRGVHRIEVDLNEAEGGAAYLRLFEQDLRGTFNRWIPAPLERSRYFPSAAAAEAALAAGGPRPQSALPLGVVLCLLMGVSVGTWLCRRAWFAWRQQRPLKLPWGTLLLSGLVLAVVLAPRAIGIPGQDATSDESFYRLSGELFVRNLELADHSPDAFRWNWEHPPVAKWLYGLGGSLGGLAGARLVSALLNALAVLFCTLLARAFFGWAVALGSAGMLAFLPHLVAHGRLVGLESLVLFFWMGSLLAAVTWARSSLGQEEEQGFRWVHGFLAPFLAVLGVASRPTALWLLPLLLVVLAMVFWRQRRLSALFPLPWLEGGFAGLLLVFLAWPWLWARPLSRLGEIFTRWAGQVPSEYLFGTLFRPPPAGYYVASFVATTPALILLFAVVGAVVGLRRTAWRIGTTLMILALLLPFLQSFVEFRQDLARYVCQAWLPLAVLASLPFGWLAAVAWPGRIWRARLATAASIGALTLYTAWALVGVEPYPLDYFNEIVGGPAAVAANRTFEVAWWGEGIAEACAHVNQIAPRGATVRISAQPGELRPRMRDDLREVDGGPADYVVTNHRGYLAEQPAGCTLEKRVEVAGAPLVDVYRCP